MNKAAVASVLLLSAFMVACAHERGAGPQFATQTPVRPEPMPTAANDLIQVAEGVQMTRTGDYIVTDPARIEQLQLDAARQSGIPTGAERLAYNGNLPVGAIMINFETRQLYFIDSRSTAIRYPVAIGALEGAEMSEASYTITRKAEWPEWRPTDRMRRMDPSLPAVVSGGAHNPLGAAALYLGSTLFRIHGTNEPESIGTAVSSGCIRMYNNHVVNLFDRVAVGARVHLIRNQAFTPGIDGPSRGVTPKI